MEIITALPEHRKEILGLLQSQNLPVEDLPLQLSDFYTAIKGEHVVGVIGMERYGRYGLLRSMVVHPDYRRQNIAGTLVNTLEQAALLTGIQVIYLLTETAADYFTRKGYNPIDRDQVADEIKVSTEYSGVCPVSAVVMTKIL